MLPVSLHSGSRSGTHHRDRDQQFFSYNDGSDAMMPPNGKAAVITIKYLRGIGIVPKEPMHAPTNAPTKMDSSPGLLVHHIK